MRKILFAGIELTSQRVRGLRGTSELPGRPAQVNIIFALPDYSSGGEFVRFVAENAGRGWATTIRVDRGCSRYEIKEV